MPRLQRVFKNLLSYFVVAGWGIFFLFAINFAAERWLYADSAYTFFRILNQEPLFYDRYANGLQILPAIFAVKLKLNAQIVLHILNISFPLLVFLFFYLTKKSSIQFLFLVLVLSFTGHHFFLGYTEVGIASLGFVICLQTLFFQTKEYIKHSLVFLGSIICYFSHPIGILYQIIFLFFIADQKQFSLSIFWFVSALIYTIFRINLPINHYDQGLLSQIFQGSVWKELYESYAWKYYTSQWYFLFGPTISVYLLSVYYAQKNKNWGYFALVSSALFALFCLFCAIYNKGEANAIMNKNIFPFCLICICILTIYFVPLNFLNKSFIILICAMQFVIMNFLEYPFYSQRNKELLSDCLKFKNNNIYKIQLLPETQKNKNWGSTWALPAESMVISALKLNSKTVNITTDTSHYLQNEYADAPFMPKGKIRNLNANYFKMDSLSNFIRK